MIRDYTVWASKCKETGFSSMPRTQIWPIWENIPVSTVKFVWYQLLFACMFVSVVMPFFLLLQHSYRLWIPQRKVFEPNQGRFLREEMDSYNWNYLDQHICGDPEFDEFIEVILMCFFLPQNTLTLVCKFCFFFCLVSKLLEGPFSPAAVFAVLTA